MSSPLYYEDLEVGLRWESGGRTITEADVVAFAGVSGDFNPIHVDAVHAGTTAFGERIAHGALVLAVATGLRQQQGTFHGTLKAWLGISDWRFRAPVKLGDTVHVITEVAGRRETRDPGAGLVTQAVEVRNQHDEVVASGEFATLVLQRAAAA
ncbi:MAG: MaoC family dehydratase N-terminal domain-containing protein [Actinomycetota bacterium]|nr:MaoC family dehydratase N-terminal domain-containing protein [Actinomycetota bacterium]